MSGGGISRDDLLNQWVELRALGHTKREIAARLGMSYVALDRAIYRARAAGDPRAAR